MSDKEEVSSSSSTSQPKDPYFHIGEFAYGVNINGWPGVQPTIYSPMATVNS